MALQRGFRLLNKLRIESDQKNEFDFVGWFATRRCRPDAVLV